MSDNNEIMEIFTALVVTCGIVQTDNQSGDDDDNSTRTGLIRSLQKFSVELRQKQKRAADGSTMQGEKDIDDDLMRIETAATDIRQACHRFVASQQVKLSEACDFFQQLSHLCTASKSYQSLILQSRSVLTAFRRKTYFDNERVERMLLHLNGLYFCFHQDILKPCLDLEAALKEATSVQSLQFRGILSVIQNWQCRLSLKGSTDRSPESSDFAIPSLEDGVTQLEIQDKDSLTPAGSCCIEHLPCLQSFPFSTRRQSSSIHSVLLVGIEGSGKTHICNEIEVATSNHARVSRLDTVGQTVGDMEDNIISFFQTAFSEPNSDCILLIDDLDEIFAKIDESKVPTIVDRSDKELESHPSVRSLATFQAMMDLTMTRSQPLNHLISLVCTAKSNLNLGLGRFDDVFVLEPPNFDERMAAIKEFVGLSQNLLKTFSESAHDLIQTSLKGLATSTVGLSYAEIAQTYRRAKIQLSEAPVDSVIISSSDTPAWVKHITLILEAVKNAVQCFSPASLRNGVVDNYVDMRVLGSDDLLDPSRSKILPSACPLYGHSSDLAWKELESQIVIPLCRSKELNLLLSNKIHSSVHGDLCGGVILTGTPGTGKSILAQHCAAFAASLLPSVKLLEVSCTSMIHKEVGASEKAVHNLFKCARAAAPCVVILDDIAIISSVRGHDNTTEGTMDRVLSTLLTELDGVERDLPTSGESSCIAVIGITQNVDWVDPALRRPGRLGKIVTLDAPDQETRRRIAQRELEHSFASQVDASHLQESLTKLATLMAGRTDGLVGANVIALCNDSKRSCVTQYIERSGQEGLPGQLELIDLMHNFIAESC